MLTEGDLANSMDQTDKVRELQDKIARLRAQVSQVSSLFRVLLTVVACALDNLLK